MQPVLWPHHATASGPCRARLTWHLQGRHSFSEPDPALSVDAAATAIWSWIGQGRVPGYRLVPQETEQ